MRTSATRLRARELTYVTGSVGESVGSSAVAFAVLVLAFVGVSVGQRGLAEAVPLVLLVSVAFVRLQTNANGQSAAAPARGDLRLSCLRSPPRPSLLHRRTCC